MYNRKWLFYEILRYAALIIIMGMSIYSLFFMFINSFKTDGQMLANFWWPDFENIHYENYITAWEKISPYIWNSVYMVGLTVIGALVVALITAYVFARFKFPLRNILFSMIIIIMMVPEILTFIPSFIVSRNLGILDTPLAIILPGIAGAQIMAIFLLRSSIEQISNELIEAARIDGASEWLILSKIVVPISVPMIMTVVLLSFIAGWNSYIWPLVTLGSEKYWTLTIGIAGLSSQSNPQITELYAAYTIASIPLLIVFLFSMKYFIRGLTSGAIKG